MFFHSLPRGLVLNGQMSLSAVGFGALRRPVVFFFHLFDVAPHLGWRLLAFVGELGFQDRERHCSQNDEKEETKEVLRIQHSENKGH